MTQKRYVRKKFLWLSRVLVGAALLTIAVGGVLSWRQFINNKTPAQPPSHVSSNTPITSASRPAPSTQKPPPNIFDTYKVAPDAPRYIFIPTISVKAMVKPVGINKAREIDVPDNVFDAGWFTRSAKPGKAGAMVIDGHIISWETHGVFYDVKKLKPGDTITIERGDGQKLNYKVLGSQTYAADKVDMKAALAPITPSKPGLNIITCAGKVIKGTNNFDKRIVIFAEQL